MHINQDLKREKISLDLVQEFHCIMEMGNMAVILSGDNIAESLTKKSTLHTEQSFTMSVESPNSLLCYSRKTTSLLDFKKQDCRDMSLQLVLLKRLQVISTKHSQSILGVIDNRES